MKKIFLTLTSFLILGSLGFAQFDNAAGPKEVEKSIFKNDLPISAGTNTEFQFLAFFINQAVTSNIYPQASLFNGQLVGRLFGSNSSTTSDSLTSFYVEQRILPFFIYQPKLFNGKAILRASFEIDWTWGDQSYGLSGNKGSAFNADNVNIQTQNIELELIPVKSWYVNIGLQRLFDTPYNPYRTFFDKMTTTGYRLAYWGSDGVGISVRHDGDYNKLKAGVYTLYENNVEDKDDVTLYELFGEHKFSMNWNMGASVHYLSDRGKGRGGPSVFSQGLMSTNAAYNGAYLFELPTNDYKADIAWLGTFFSRNTDFWNDPYQLSGFFNFNLGSVKTYDGTDYVKDTDIAGFALNLRGAYRFGQTVNDFVSADFLYTTGDGDGNANGTYSGVITGNTWGMPGAIFVSSGSYLLFPHASVINRFTPVVSDISNMGYGVTGGTLTANYDFIPNRINLKLGTAAALSTVSPQNADKYMGAEINGSLRYTFGPFMTLELNAAYLKLGEFFDSNDSSHGTDINGPNYKTRPTDPWTVFLAYKWLMF